MLNTSQTFGVTSDPSPSPKSFLTESLAAFISSSESVTQRSDEIQEIRGQMTSPGKMNIMAKEQQECLKYLEPATFGERFLEYFGSQSKRQVLLRTRADVLGTELREAEVNNRVCKLRAAAVVQSVYKELFAFNDALDKGLALLATPVMLAESREREWRDTDSKATRAQRESQPFFVYGGAPPGVLGPLAYDNPNSIQDVHRRILKDAERAYKKSNSLQV